MPAPTSDIKCVRYRKSLRRSRRPSLSLQIQQTMEWGVFLSFPPEHPSLVWCSLSSKQSLCHITCFVNSFFTTLSLDLKHDYFVNEAGFHRQEHKLRAAPTFFNIQASSLLESVCYASPFVAVSFQIKSVLFAGSVIGGDGFRLSSIVTAKAGHQQCPYRYLQGVAPDAETKEVAKAGAPPGSYCQHDIVLPTWRQQAVA